MKKQEEVITIPRGYFATLISSDISASIPHAAIIPSPILCHLLGTMWGLETPMKKMKLSKTDQIMKTLYGPFLWKWFQEGMHDMVEGIVRPTREWLSLNEALHQLEAENNYDRNIAISSITQSQEKNPEIIPALIKALDKEQDDNNIEEILICIVEKDLKSPEITEAIMRTAKNMMTTQPRSYYEENILGCCVTALGKIATPTEEMLDFLLECFKTSTNVGTINLIIGSIGNLGIKRKSVIEMIFGLCNREEYVLQGSITLGKLGAEEVKEILLRRLKEEEDETIRREVGRALTALTSN